MGQLVLQPDEASAVDTYVREAFAASSYETNAALYAVLQVGSNRHSFILWDLSSIPAGSVVDSATMSLWTASTAAAVSNAYAILVANSGWIEACTWNFADGASASDRWAGDAANNGGADAGCSVSGTDYGAATIGAWTMGGVSNAEISSALTTAAVQAWVDGANYGMVLIGADATLATWHSSSSTTAGYRPKIIVNYTEIHNLVADDLISGTPTLGTPILGTESPVITARHSLSGLLGSPILQCG